MGDIKIGYVIKRLLRRKSKTLKQVSREVQIPYSTLHTWAENRQPQDIVSVQRLADYFDLSLRELLFDQSDPGSCGKGISQHEAFLDEIAEGRFEVVVRRMP